MDELAKEDPGNELFRSFSQDETEERQREEIADVLKLAYPLIFLSTYFNHLIKE